MDFLLDALTNWLKEMLVGGIMGKMCIRDRVWAEAMMIYRSGEYSMKFSKEIQNRLIEVQRDFMPEDTEAGPVSYTHLEAVELADVLGYDIVWQKRRK